jgi:hypothetical protein
MSKPNIASRPWRLILTELLPIVGVIAGVIGVAHFSNKGAAHTYSWSALLLASAGMGLIFALIDFVGMSSQEDDSRSRYGWLRIILGTDGRLSTGKSQVFLWTIGLAAAILFLGGIVIFHPGRTGNVFQDTNWNDYLILLGGPFAAAVIAQFTVATKIVDGTLQKVPTAAAAPAAIAVIGQAPAGNPQLSDVVSNDDGDPDLVDIQYFIFNVVVFLYVFGDFISRIIDKGITDFSTKYSLPSVPAVLLGLTSASALGYVGTKTALKNAPRISTINPLPPVAGNPVDIIGVNLVPPGTDLATVTQRTLVSVVNEADGTQAAVLAPTAATATKVTFDLPARFAGSTVNLQVVTAGGAATDPYQTAVP